ncbi:hypothetical protein [Thermomonospora umbrina]|uniref:Uncharacterized protein n=1 Tax=Thermomonospora umbrina TaxID=111806 RepID=A0A3D9ST12_9ACTN|nr:hypothetical protein [Thermomonospora umbrina]REE97620.1 hypothetical protein DFJ69_3093 [Thermomonospora umbrina]
MKKWIYLGLGVMVVWTGGYVFLYTARWEWQRALMAGELLLVSMLVLLAVAGVDRFNRLERRIGELGERRDAVPDSPASLSAPYGAPGVETPTFRWLHSESNSYKVFIPVLLGAGIVVSGLAALVERISSRLGGRVGARSGSGLAPLSAPTGGVLAGAPDLAAPERPRRTRSLVLGSAAVLVAGLAVFALADLTQDRPDEPVRAAAGTVVFEASANGRSPVDAMTRRLWEYCRGSTRPYLKGGGLTALGGGRYAVVVQPALGEHALRRFKGCIEDAVIDHGNFRVVGVHPEPE